MLALRELLGSRLKFGLIAAAIGLVVALTLLMSAMSEGLITGMTGAEGSLAGDALVFQRDTQLSLERSILTRDDLNILAVAPGVSNLYAVGHAMISVDAGAGVFDARLLGLSAGFEQLPLVEGRPPQSPGEALVDITAKANGVALGDPVRLSPVDGTLTVVGFTRDRRYVMSPVFYVDMATWRSLYVAALVGPAPGGSSAGGGAQGPGTAGVEERLSGEASIAAVRLDDGVTAADLAAALGDRYEVATPAAAARAGNGMPVMVLAVNGIQVVSLLIGALVIGIFFYITTLHKTGQIAAIKALGASNGYLYRQLLLQIVVLVTLAVVVGMALALGAGASMPSTMAFDPGLGRWGVSLIAVYAMALLGSLFSLRNILSIDPAIALDRAEH
ncbi:MAG TPA: ABC transporter permease [Thermoleophilia bacterium]|nr:ABC transporter permease [Thermoleophilia bacterium]